MPKKKRAIRTWLQDRREWLVDRSFGVSCALALVVIAHAVATIFWPSLNPYKSLMLDNNTGTAVTLYLGAAAAAAIVAGFAGVVIIFTIGSDSARIKQFRFEAGKELRTAWLAVVAAPFAATLLGIVSAMVHVTSGKQVAPWFFEAGLAFLIHGALLLLDLLSHLIEIVDAQDTEDTKDKNQLSTDELF